VTMTYVTHLLLLNQNDSYNDIFGITINEDIIYKYALSQIDLNTGEDFDTHKEKIFEYMELVSTPDNVNMALTIDDIMFTFGCVMKHINIYSAIIAGGSEYKDELYDMCLDILDFKIAKESSLTEDFIHIISDMMNLMDVSLTSSSLNNIDVGVNVLSVLVNYRFNKNLTALYNTGKVKQDTLQKTFIEIYNEIVIDGIVKCVAELLNLDLSSEHDNRNYVTSYRLFFGVITSVIPFRHMGVELHNKLRASPLGDTPLLDGDTGMIMKIIHDVFNLYFVESDNNEPTSFIQLMLDIIDKMLK